jgi:hypothetical protein
MKNINTHLPPDQENALTDNLTIKAKEILNISQFAKSPHLFMDQVSETNNKMVIIRNGKPIVGLVPLWCLCVIDDFINGRLIDATGGGDSGGHPK